MAAQRYTRKDAETAFELLLSALGKQKGAWNEVGAWSLDYAACYGGYTVHEVANTSGGIRQPMGSERRTAREFVAACRFARYALDVKAGA